LEPGESFEKHIPVDARKHSDHGAAGADEDQARMPHANKTQSQRDAARHIRLEENVARIGSGVIIRRRRVISFITAMARRMHYHVYVIELSKEVLNESRFRRANPDYIAGKPCVYVGMTGLDPDVRFDKHKAGIQSNRYAQQFGLRLLPELYECYNPMPYDGARDMEVELAIGLRESGYGVWQA
jgi:hypothetical protein